MAIREATTTGTRALIALYSESGGGKTLSALLLARGLVGPKGKIVQIDTENRRGEFFAKDPRINGYLVRPLNEPFSPDNYIEAINEAEDAGADAIIIDSGSHEWEGIGGVLDMATSLAERRFHRQEWNKGKEFDGTVSFGDWKEPKTQHKHLIAKLQRVNAHVIVCLRAQYKSRQIDKADYEKYGIVSKAKTTVIRDETQTPIQEERFIFEMTVHLQMSNQHPGVPIITKCPDMLLPAFEPGTGKPISVATGERIAAFYAEGAPNDQATKDLIGKARKAAKAGLESYQAFFVALDVTERRTLVTAGEHDRIKAKLIPAEPEPEPDPEPDPRDNPGPGFTDDDGDPGPEPRPGYIPPNFDDTF